MTLDSAVASLVIGLVVGVLITIPVTFGDEIARYRQKRNRDRLKVETLVASTNKSLTELTEAADKYEVGSPEFVRRCHWIADLYRWEEDQMQKGSFNDPGWAVRYYRKLRGPVPEDVVEIDHENRDQTL
jgi:hypothetical protein